MFYPRKTKDKGKVVRKKITFYFTGKHAELVKSRIKTFSIRFPDSKTTNDLMAGKAMNIRSYHGNMEGQQLISNGGALITGVAPIKFDHRGMVMGQTKRILEKDELLNIAYRDGFASWSEFVDYYLKRRTAYSYRFKKHGDTTFKGIILTWKWIDGLENEGFYSDCRPRREAMYLRPWKEAERVAKHIIRDAKIHGPEIPFTRMASQGEVYVPRAKQKKKDTISFERAINEKRKERLGRKDKEWKDAEPVKKIKSVVPVKFIKDINTVKPIKKIKSVNSIKHVKEIKESPKPKPIKRIKNKTEIYLETLDKSKIIVAKQPVVVEVKEKKKVKLLREPVYPPKPKKKWKEKRDAWLSKKAA